MFYIRFFQNEITIVINSDADVTNIVLCPTMTNTMLYTVSYINIATSVSSSALIIV